MHGDWINGDENDLTFTYMRLVGVLQRLRRLQNCTTILAERRTIKPQKHKSTADRLCLRCVDAVYECFPHWNCASAEACRVKSCIQLVSYRMGFFDSPMFLNCASNSLADGLSPGLVLIIARRSLPTSGSVCSIFCNACVNIPRIEL